MCKIIASSTHKLGSLLKINERNNWPLIGSVHTEPISGHQAFLNYTFRYNSECPVAEHLLFFLS